jgi:hypothetical protein
MAMRTKRVIGDENSQEHRGDGIRGEAGPDLIAARSFKLSGANG